MEHPKLTLFLILALIILAWWLVSRLISAALEDLVDIVRPGWWMLDGEEIRVDVEIEIGETRPSHSHERS